MDVRLKVREYDSPRAEERVAIFELHEAKSLIFVQIFKDRSTMLSGFAHDHVVRATGWSGTVRFDVLEPALCSVAIEVPVAGLAVDEPHIRSRVGYDTNLSERERAETEQNMRGERQLDAKRYPTIRFHSTSCRMTSGDANAGVLDVEGALQIRGRTVSVRLPMEYVVKGGLLEVRGRFQSTHKAFGFNPYVAFLGGVRVAQEMTFVIDVVGRSEQQ